MIHIIVDTPYCIYSYSKHERITMYKNIEKKNIIELKNLVEYQEGQTLIMPKGIAHFVYGEHKFKMQLIASF